MDHLRFSPIQTDFAKDMCKRYEMPFDVSTAVFIDENRAYKDSSSILRLFPYMGLPYNLLGPLALLVPAIIRNFAYRRFARNRGAIWKSVKRVTGMGDTRMEQYRDRILGLQDPPDPPAWGFQRKE